MPVHVHERAHLEELLSGIEMLGTRLADWTFDWKITDCETGWYIQSSFERPDANAADDDTGTGYGRKWFVESGTPDTGVVFTAWMAIHQQIIIHELHKSFTVTVNGERVRLLDPHKDLADLAVGSRRITKEEC